MSVCVCVCVYCVNALMFGQEVIRGSWLLLKGGCHCSYEALLGSGSPLLITVIAISEQSHFPKVLGSFLALAKLC